MFEVFFPILTINHFAFSQKWPSLTPKCRLALSPRSPNVERGTRDLEKWSLLVADTQAPVKKSQLETQ